MTDVRTLFRWVGGVITAVTALFAFAFGLSLISNLYMTLLVAIALACGALGSAYTWPFVADALSKKRWVYACFIALIAILFTSTSVVTNFGSISGQRVTILQPQAIENVCNDDTCGALPEHEKTLKLWEDRRSRLLAEKPWLATVSTEALREDLVRSSEAIRKESNRGGCGPICRRLMRKHSELSKRFAAAEQLSEISKNIASTRRKIALARKTSAETGETASPGLLQNAVLERFFTLTRVPSETVQNFTDRIVNWIVAAFLTFAAAGANYLGWWGIGSGSRFGSRAPPGAPVPPGIAHQFHQFKMMTVDRPPLAKRALAGLATIILGAATVAVFDHALGWQGLLFSGPIVFLLGSGLAWWIADVYKPSPSDPR